MGQIWDFLRSVSVDFGSAYLERCVFPVLPGVVEADAGRDNQDGGEHDVVSGGELLELPGVETVVAVENWLLHFACVWRKGVELKRSLRVFKEF